MCVFVPFGCTYSLRQSDGISVATEGSYTLYMFRTDDLASPIIEPKTPFHMQVTDSPRRGGSGQVYYSDSPYVLKFAYRTSNSRQMLQNEVNRYRALESAGVQGLARCHGMFRSVDDLALVFDDGGKELNDFDGLNNDLR